MRPKLCRCGPEYQIEVTTWGDSGRGIQVWHCVRLQCTEYGGHETPARYRTDAVRLADTEAAVLYTGRPRGTLYRWAHEGRITRYGTRSRALWDLDRLPPAVPGGALPPPPPLPHALTFRPGVGEDETAPGMPGGL